MVAVAPGGQSPPAPEPSGLPLILSCCPDIPGRFWCFHAQGIWAINIPWLPALVDFLSDAHGPGHGNKVRVPFNIAVMPLDTATI